MLVRSTTRPKRIVAAVASVVATLALVANAWAGDANREMCPVSTEASPGYRSNLPDCRAYEVVSQSNSNDTANITGAYGFPEGTHVLYKNFLPTSTGHPGNGFVEDVLATRSASGWTQQPITSHQGVASPEQPSKLIVAEAASEISISDNFERAFINSPFQDPFEELRLNQTTGFNVYEVALPSGDIALISIGDSGPTTQSMIENPEYATAAAQIGWGSFLVGSSADGSKVFFETLAKLSTAPGTPAASNTSGNEVYMHTDGHTYLVGVLPDGSVPTCGAAVAGVMSTTERENHYSYGAVAPDGANVVFGTCTGAYLRNTESQTTVTLPGGSFLGRTGTAAGQEEEIFTQGAEEGTIYEYHVATEETDEVGIGRLMAYSANGEVVYSVDESEGDRGIHVYDKGVVRLLPGTESGGYEGGFLGGNAIPTASGRVSNLPVATPDGASLLFIDSGGLKHYENAGHHEAYIYDAVTNKTICISCNEKLHEAAGETQLIDQFYADQGNASFHTASPPLIAVGGQRAVFETTESLLPEDTNGIEDVYEWVTVEADGCGVGSAHYSRVARGCLYLLSPGTGTGQITKEGVSGSHLIGASENLKDVFLQTNELLTPGSDYAAHIYDVREDGGFPYMPSSFGCEEGSCRTMSGEAQGLFAAATETFEGRALLNVRHKAASVRGMRVCRHRKHGRRRRGGCERRARRGGKHRKARGSIRADARVSK